MTQRTPHSKGRRVTYTMSPPGYNPQGHMQTERRMHSCVWADSPDRESFVPRMGMRFGTFLSNIRHAYGGQLSSFTNLRALLVLHDCCITINLL
jgi:hypothetical protein